MSRLISIYPAVILIFVSYFYSCKQKDEIGIVNFNYSLPFKINDSTIEKNDSFLNHNLEIYRDNIILRFMQEFNKDTFSITVEDTFYQEYKDLTTNGSIGYAKAIILARNLFQKPELILELRGLKYTIPYKHEYRFIDIYIDDKNHLQIEYNNTIWVLT